MEPELTFAGSICRVCLQLSSNRYDILKSGLELIYFELTGIKVQEDEGLPAVMCPTCVYLLARAVRFRRKCLDSECYLRDFLRSGQTEFDVDKTLRPPYLTLQVGETVVCEVPSTLDNEDRVERQQIVSESDIVWHDYQSEICPDFEQFDDECVPNSESSNITHVNMQKDLIGNGSICEEQTHVVKSIYGDNLGENAVVKYSQEDKSQSNMAENTIDDLPQNEKSQYTLKSQYTKYIKSYRARDGTVIDPLILMGPNYLRIDHLTVDQQIADLDQKRNSEIYLIKPLKCHSCAVSYWLEFQYKEHMKKHDLSAGLFECSLCKVRLRSDFFLREHMNRHRVRFVCMKCGFRLNSRKNHTRHIMQSHIGFPEITCTLCNKQYKNFMNYKSHYRKIHKKPNRRCPDCPEKFNTRENLLKHIAITHTAAGLPLVCPYCPKRFLFLNNLKRHKLIHEGKLRCDNCKAGFVHDGTLQKHVLKGCDKAFDYYARECNQCPEVFAKPLQLRYHKAKVHQEHTFRCDTCDISFLSAKYLERHNRKGHKPCQCAHCEKRFKNARSLNIHMRRAHNINPEEKPIKTSLICHKRVCKPKPLVRCVRRKLPDQENELLTENNLKKSLYQRTYMSETLRQPVGTKGNNTFLDESLQDKYCIKKIVLTHTSQKRRKLMKLKKNMISKKELQKKVFGPTPQNNCKKHLMHCSDHRVQCVENFDFGIRRDSEKIICDFCNDSFVSPSEFDQHISKHSKKLIYTCKFCSSQFLDYASIYVHTQCIHADQTASLYNMCNCIPRPPFKSLQSIHKKPKKKFIKYRSRAINIITVKDDEVTNYEQVALEQAKIENDPQINEDTAKIKLIDADTVPDVSIVTAEKEIVRNNKYLLPMGKPKYQLICTNFIKCYSNRKTNEAEENQSKTNLLNTQVIDANTVSNAIIPANEIHNIEFQDSNFKYLGPEDKLTDKKIMKTRTTHKMIRIQKNRLPISLPAYIKSSFSMNVSQNRTRDISPNASTHQLTEVVFHGKQNICRNFLPPKNISVDYLKTGATSQLMQLYASACEFAKVNSYRFVWIQGGRVYMRKEMNTPVFIITNEQQLPI